MCRVLSKWHSMKLMLQSCWKTYFHSLLKYLFMYSCKQTSLISQRTTLQQCVMIITWINSLQKLHLWPSQKSPWDLLMYSFMSYFDTLVIHGYYHCYHISFTYNIRRKHVSTLFDVSHEQMTYFRRSCASLIICLHSLITKWKLITISATNTIYTLCYIELFVCCIPSIGFNHHRVPFEKKVQNYLRQVWQLNCPLVSIVSRWNSNFFQGFA